MKETSLKTSGVNASTCLFSKKNILKAVAAGFKMTVSEVTESSPESIQQKTALYLINERSEMDTAQLRYVFPKTTGEPIDTACKKFKQKLATDKHLYSILSGIESHAELLSVYGYIRELARGIVSTYPTPDFYHDFSIECKRSKEFYTSNQLIKELKLTVSRIIKDDFGHGMNHSQKVALDAGALILAETNNQFTSTSHQEEMLLLVQCASLLHDIKRKEKHHARKGAMEAKKILRNYPFDQVEIEDISLAIYNHEAFSEKIKATSDRGKMVAGCLYDADKFRWGPDNFNDTVWDMASYTRIPLPEFMKRYPHGLRTLERIKETFRTKTGKKYGPRFIDAGLAIGKELNPVIRSEFAEYLGGKK